MPKFEACSPIVIQKCLNFSIHFFREGGGVLPDKKDTDDRRKS